VISDVSGTRRTARNIAALCLFGLVSGCSLVHFPGRTVFVSSYEPSNVYREEPILPPEIKRVAILPLSIGDSTTELEFGRDTLGPVLAGELVRSRQFETVLVSPEQLRRLMGAGQWSGSDRFAEDYFAKLGSELGVQGVILPELTQYRAHEPLAIGWRVKLVDAVDPRVIWAVDEVFDARVPSVAAAARRYAEGHPDTSRSVADDRAVLQSPRRFARYTVNAVVGTLPSRAEGEGLKK
jgi:hypothetical protein